MSANMVFKNLDEPRGLKMVRIFEGEPDGRLYHVTGWSSAGGGSPGEARVVQVEDSSEGSAYLVYGGDWGIRLRPEGSEDWRLDDQEQWGETHLVLADIDDIVFDAP
jgi:hypothetical protein